MPKKQQTPPYYLPLANTLGVFGYISCLLQWFWLVIILLPLFMNTGIAEFVTPQESTHDVAVMTFEPSPVVVGLVVLIAAAVMAASIVVLLRLPREIGSAGKKLTQASAQAVTPAFTHHKKLSKKKQRELTFRITRAVKLAFILLPLGGLALTYFAALDLPYALIMIVGVFCAGASMLWFGLQYSLAWIWKLPEDKLI